MASAKAGAICVWVEPLPFDNTTHYDGPMLLLFAAPFVIASWIVWFKQRPIFGSPDWRTITTIGSLAGVTLAFMISIWMIAAHQGEELFYGTLMRMQPWPRIAGYSGIASIVFALTGKRGTRTLVVVAALLIELSNFAAVLTD